MAAVFCVGGSVLAAAAPAFFRDLHASRTSEAVDGIAVIARHAVAYSLDRELPASFPPPSPLTPAEVHRGKRALDPPGTWDTPTWKALDFGFKTPHYYSFAFDVGVDTARIWFKARACGDLNGDGLTSAFELDGERRPGQQAVVLPTMFVHREIE